MVREVRLGWHNPWRRLDEEFDRFRPSDLPEDAPEEDDLQRVSRRRRSLNPRAPRTSRPKRRAG